MNFLLPFHSNDNHNLRASRNNSSYHLLGACSDLSFLRCLGKEAV